MIGHLLFIGSLIGWGLFAFGLLRLAHEWYSLKRMSGLMLFMTYVMVFYFFFCAFVLTVG